MHDLSVLNFEHNLSVLNFNWINSACICNDPIRHLHITECLLSMLWFQCSWNQRAKGSLIRWWHLIYLTNDDPYKLWLFHSRIALSGLHQSATCNVKKLMCHGKVCLVQTGLGNPPKQHFVGLQKSCCNYFRPCSVFIRQYLDGTYYDMWCYPSVHPSIVYATTKKILFTIIFFWWQSIYIYILVHT